MCHFPLIYAKLGVIQTISVVTQPCFRHVRIQIIWISIITSCKCYRWHLTPGIWPTLFSLFFRKSYVIQYIQWRIEKGYLMLDTYASFFSEQGWWLIDWLVLRPAQEFFTFIGTVVVVTLTNNRKREVFTANHFNGNIVDEKHFINYTVYSIITSELNMIAHFFLALWVLKLYQWWIKHASFWKNVIIQEITL
jgi:hypothetical protein